MYTHFIFNILLVIHIFSGSLALLSSFGAMASTKGGYWHRKAGKFFIISMTSIFITAIPMAILKNNLFLFLIALFSYYLAFTGWRYAKNRSGIPLKIDWVASGIMLIVAILMIAYGYHQYLAQDYHGIVLAIFGFIASRLALFDLKTFKTHDATGKQRIIKHLRGMFGATIAALTAFTVTNVHLKPELLLWLAPTLLLTPLIIWWSKKIANPKQIYSQKDD